MDQCSFVCPYTAPIRSSKSKSRTQWKHQAPPVVPCLPPAFKTVICHGCGGIPSCYIHGPVGKQFDQKALVQDFLSLSSVLFCWGQLQPLLTSKELYLPKCKFPYLPASLSKCKSSSSTECSLCPHSYNSMCLGPPASAASCREEAPKILPWWLSLGISRCIEGPDGSSKLSRMWKIMNWLSLPV